MHVITAPTMQYSQKPTELNVSKGELVKVTNSAMDKDWSLAVTTVGKSGSVKKKHLEQVQPGEYPQLSEPAKYAYLYTENKQLNITKKHAEKICYNLV